MAEQAKWYVVHTYSGYENMVATSIEKAVKNLHLQDFILAVSVPLETVTEIKDNKRREVERKVFPGYVLVKMIMNDECWHVVRNTRGVTGFVGPESQLVGHDSKPEPLTDEEVQALGVDKHEVILNYAVGDSVRITSSAFYGQVGRVSKIDVKKNQVVILVPGVLGRDATMELSLTQVEPIDA